MEPKDLRKAIEQGQDNEVKTILDSINTNFSEKELTNALYPAAREAKAQIVAQLLSHGARISEMAFLGACMSQAPAVFQQFINHGWDINSTKFGDPALRLVVSNFTCTKFLLEKGADPNLRGEKGATPLATAALEPSVEVLDLLLSYGAEMDPMALYNAISRRGRGGLPAMKFLIERGVDVNAPEKGKATPLHWAVRCGDKERVQLLLENGADKANNSFAGRTPADLAQEQGQMEIYDILSR